MQTPLTPESAGQLAVFTDAAGALAPRQAPVTAQTDAGPAKPAARRAKKPQATAQLSRIAPERLVDTLQRIGLSTLAAAQAGGSAGLTRAAMLAAGGADHVIQGLYAYFVDVVEERGILAQDGQCYRMTETGQAFLAVLADRVEKPVPRVECPPDWNPGYSPWRHGGWYTNARYPNGGCGCISKNYVDKKWRIACDPRFVDIGEEGDFTFKTREAAARAEYVLTVSMSIAWANRSRAALRARRRRLPGAAASRPQPSHVPTPATAPP